MEKTSPTTPRRGPMPKFPPCEKCKKYTQSGNPLILCPQKTHSIHMKCHDKMPPKCGCNWPEEQDSTPKRTRSASSKAKASTSASPAESNKAKLRRSPRLALKQQETDDGDDILPASEDESTEDESEVDSDEEESSYYAPQRTQNSTRRAKPRSVESPLAHLVEVMEQVPDAMRNLSSQLKESRGL